MGLNKTKGNMYSFINFTWNTVKGKCPHNCSYCYMKRWGEQKLVRFDGSELNTDLGDGNFIFVGSSCDLFADAIPKKWIYDTLFHCRSFTKNKYLLQTKNPIRYHEFYLPENFILGTTIETNRTRATYPQMGNAPHPVSRANILSKIKNKKFITIEPIIDFDLEIFAEMINSAEPDWVNIGADSGNNNLPEPSKEKIDELIKLLNGRITIKKNMKRIK